MRKKQKTDPMASLLALHKAGVMDIVSELAKAWLMEELGTRAGAGEGWGSNLEQLITLKAHEVMNFVLESPRFAGRFNLTEDEKVAFFTTATIGCAQLLRNPLGPAQMLATPELGPVMRRYHSGELTMEQAIIELKKVPGGVEIAKMFVGV